jgi:hypothetical protein
MIPNWIFMYKLRVFFNDLILLLTYHVGIPPVIDHLGVIKELFNLIMDEQSLFSGIEL